MKKLITIFIIFISTSIFASNENIIFNLSSDSRLDENEWQVYLPKLKIDLWDSMTKYFNFFIDSDDYFIFANDISQIKINNIKTNIDNIFLDSNNKVLRIELDEEKNWSLEISWIQIRTYDKEIRDAKIWFDYNNDDIIDIYSDYTINLEENGKNDDTMKPLWVSQVEYTLMKNKNDTFDLNIIWENSPDLDIYGSFIKVYKNNSYWNIKEQFILKWSEQVFHYVNMDLEKDIFRIEIFSKDYYYSNNDPYIIILDKSSIQNLLQDDINENNVEQENIGENNLSENQDFEKEIKNKTIDPIEEEITNKENIVRIEKYNPSYSTYIKILNNFVTELDEYISLKKKKDLSLQKENNLIIIRNDIVKITEKLDLSTKTTKESIIKELINRIKDLKIEIKK